MQSVLYLKSNSYGIYFTTEVEDYRTIEHYTFYKLQVVTNVYVSVYYQGTW